MSPTQRLSAPAPAPTNRFNEIDLCGIGNAKANRIDPMRDIMAKVFVKF